MDLYSYSDDDLTLRRIPSSTNNNSSLSNQRLPSSKRLTVIPGGDGKDGGDDHGWRRDSVTNTWIPNIDTPPSFSLVVSPSLFASSLNSIPMEQTIPLDGVTNNDNNNFSIEARTENIVDYLFRKDGCSFPLKKNVGGTLDLEVVVRGIKIPVALSSTRRSMTISELDTLKYNLSVNKNDLVCTIPSKKCEMYCGKVEFFHSDPTYNYNRMNEMVNVKSNDGMPSFSFPPFSRHHTSGGGSNGNSNSGSGHSLVEVKRFQYFVGDGSFKSRLGLICTMEERGIFTHLRLKDDTFCIDLSHSGSEKILFGEMALPPSARHNSGGRQQQQEVFPHCRNIEVPLIPMDEGGKNRIVFPCVKVHLGGKKKFRFGGEMPIQAILHLEIPTVCLPRRLFQYFMHQIIESTGLFDNERLSEPSNVVNQYMGRFPRLRFWLKTVNGSHTSSGGVRMSLYPDEYIVPHPHRPVMGNTILNGRKVTFRRTELMAHFW